MKVINLRMHQLRALKELELNSDVFNTEALMLILNKKYKSPNGERLLLKYLDAQDDPKTMGRKLYTINMLNSSSSYSNIKELIIPEYAVVVDSNIAGFAMPLVENHKNLGSYLNDENISFAKKKKYLIAIGNILDKVQRIEDEPFKMQFADLNEYNFIIDSNDNVKAVDLDSAYVGQTDPSDMAYYLLKNEYLAAIPAKYKSTKNGILIPSDNTDLYCYSMIILDTLANESMFKKDLDTYYSYLDYLKRLGLSNDFISCYKNIYNPKDNYNPKDLINDIPDNIEEYSDFKKYQKVRRSI
jgi:hypothetical protein